MLVIVFDAVALLLVLVAVIYVRADTVHPQDQPKFPIHTGDGGEEVEWDTRVVFDPIYWNCALYPIIYDRDRRGPIKKLCREGKSDCQNGDSSTCWC